MSGILELPMMQTTIAGAIFFVLTTPQSYKLTSGTNRANHNGCPSSMEHLMHTLMFFIFIFTWSLLVNLVSTNKQSMKTLLRYCIFLTLLFYFFSNSEVYIATSKAMQLVFSEGVTSIFSENGCATLLGAALHTGAFFLAAMVLLGSPQSIFSTIFGTVGTVLRSTLGLGVYGTRKLVGGVATLAEGAEQALDAGYEEGRQIAEGTMDAAANVGQVAAGTVVYTGQAVGQVGQQAGQQVAQTGQQVGQQVAHTGQQVGQIAVGTAVVAGQQGTEVAQQAVAASQAAAAQAAYAAQQANQQGAATLGTGADQIEPFYYY